MQAGVQLQIQVPSGTPEQAAEYVLELLRRIEEGREGADGVDVELVEAERTIEAALAHYKRAWPQRFPFLQRLHYILLGLGYEARLPESRRESRNQYPYMRYTHPGDTTLGTANSGSFTFAGKFWQERLAGDDLGDPTRDGVRYQLDTEQSVQRIAEIAEQAWNERA